MMRYEATYKGKTKNKGKQRWTYISYAPPVVYMLMRTLFQSGKGKWLGSMGHAPCHSIYFNLVFVYFYLPGVTVFKFFLWKLFIVLKTWWELSITTHFFCWLIRSTLPSSADSLGEGSCFEHYVGQLLTRTSLSRSFVNSCVLWPIKVALFSTVLVELFENVVGIFKDKAHFWLF